MVHSQNIRYLKEHGPATLEELPGDKVSPTERREGVWKLKLGGGPMGSSDSMGGKPRLVYYLRDEHSRAEVLRKFLEANPKFLEAKTGHAARQILRRQGRQWHDAIDEVLPSEA